MNEVQLPASLRDVEPVQSIRTPVRLEYTFRPGQAAQQYLRGYKDGKIMGQKSPVDGAVFVPPRGVDARHGAATTEYVELTHTGHVGSFCITKVPIPGRDDLEIPYVSAWIFLDGADIGFLHLVSEIEPSEVRIGMRVEAVWKDEADFETSATNVKWFKPTGEPDIPFDQAGVRRWSHKHGAGSDA